MNKTILFALALVIVLTPLGLISEYSAWGEWSPEEFVDMIGFIPSGIENTKPLLDAVIPDYELESIGAIASYYLSAVIGVALCFGGMWLLKPKTQN